MKQKWYLIKNLVLFATCAAILTSLQYFQLIIDIECTGFFKFYICTKKLDTHKLQLLLIMN